MPARAWLQDRFEESVISCLNPITWLGKSPDLSCLDDWFWGVALAEVRRSLSITPAELKAIVEDFSKSIEEEEVNKAARVIMKRASACRAVGGSAFWYKLEKNPKVFGGNEGVIVKRPIVL